MAKFNTINPSNNVNIKSVDFVSIDVSGYTGKSVYGKVGEKATGKSSSLTSKLNYRTEYDPDDKLGTGADPKHPYVYIKETDDTYYRIEQTLNMGSATVNDKRQIYIGSKNEDGTRELNGNTNIDDIYVDDFYYNFGNSERYSDHDLGIDSKSGALIQTGSHTIKHPKEDGTEEEIKLTDDLNTSNTMTKTMDYYNVVVKPMNARDL